MRVSAGCSPLDEDAGDARDERGEHAHAVLCHAVSCHSMS